MTVLVANVQLTNTIDYWRNQTNLLANTVNNYVVTVNNNPTVGDAVIIGNIQANTVWVPTALNGGTVGSLAAFFINSGVTLSNVATFSANTILNGNVYVNNGLVANNSKGSAGNILYSNGTGAYWNTAPAGTVTSVSSGNGLTGGPVTSSGTLSVLANTGIIANSTGVFANSTYISSVVTPIIGTNPSNFANSTNNLNINGNANNISGYVINQNLSTANSPSFAALTSNNITVNGTAFLNGNTSAISVVLDNAIETTTVSATAATGTINFDVISQSVLYYTTNAIANWTLNVRGNSTTTLNNIMANGQSLTIAFMAAQGVSPFYSSALTIDGSSVTPRYQGGAAWTFGNANSIDTYAYTIIKTGTSAYTVLASQTQFK